ncbi:MAG: hypothetical protein IJK14_09525 [Clostridia bacterium]|nr:hypothetical protein [Clostridia bacterium]
MKQTDASKPEKREKRKGIGWIVLAVLLLAAAVGGYYAYNRYYLPEKHYAEALELMNAGQYPEAAEAFEAMDGYKDSATGLTESRYRYALQLMEEKRYSEAREIFTGLGGYQNSADWLEKIPVFQYNEAVALMEAGDYRGAYQLFSETEGIGSTPEHIETCLAEITLEDAYEAALSLKNNGRYEEAAEAFRAIGDYRDCAEQVEACIYAGKDVIYEHALSLLSSGNVVEGFELLVPLKGHRDSGETADRYFEQYQQEKLTDANVEDNGYLYFGSYEQDNDPDNGPEPIKWLVLKKDGNEALLISQYGLDCMPYHSAWKKTSWKDCSVRKWLNGAFLKAAFSTAEQERILKETVSAHTNPRAGFVKQGQDTKDRVFLLSVKEAESQFTPYTRRPCGATAYAIAQGLQTSDTNMVDDKPTCWWMLRTLAYSRETVTNVDLFGNIDYRYGSVAAKYAVRPSIRIRLGS